MRLVIALVFLASTFLCTTAANAQRTTPVTVVNSPNQPVPVEVVAPTADCPQPAAYVGITTATGNGTTGILAFNTMCNAEFPGSRMCISEELMNTVNPPQDYSGDAWIRPVFKPFAITGANDQQLVAEASGVYFTPTQFTCSGWLATSGFSGLTVMLPSGSFRPLSCDTARPVACCR